MSPSLLRLRSKNKNFDASNLGGLINSPSDSMFKTAYNIKAGSFAIAKRRNMQFWETEVRNLKINENK